MIISNNKKTEIVKIVNSNYITNRHLLIHSGI